MVDGGNNRFQLFDENLEPRNLRTAGGVSG